MTAKKGDIVLVRPERGGGAGRQGLVVSALGTMLKIRWDDASESLFIPGPGTLTVVGHERNPKRVKSSH